MPWELFFVAVTLAIALLWNRLCMVVSFLVKPGALERWHLLELRWKLALLKALAREIGEAETRIAEIERLGE